jgi:hypothetical protein
VTYRLDGAATRGWADRTMREGPEGGGGTRETGRLAFLFFFSTRRRGRVGGRW